MIYKLKNYIKLMRFKHCIKNILILLPLIFSGSFFVTEKLIPAVFAFVSFTFLASSVYALNDICDREKDRMHPRKKNRPIASGAVSVKEGIVIFAVSFMLSMLANYFTGGGILSYACLLVYFAMNVFYSGGIKNVPILDVVILAAGFMIRLIYGGIATDMEISGWLYLTIIMVSFYMGMGKRRNELDRKGENTSTRGVLKYYSYAFLYKNMYMCLGLAEVFYALWAMDTGVRFMLWTVPLIIVAGLKYSLDIEGEDDGDPVEVIAADKILWILILLYSAVVITLIYVIK